MDRKFKKTINYLNTKKRILFLTTSNRWNDEKPKSTQLAYQIAQRIPNVTLLEIPHFKIYPCEGNVSAAAGNNCGVKAALLKDKMKNPSGLHRCWASINNKDDELWKVSQELFQSDCVIFFGSIRWGQMNSYYQKLIERLTWIENRHVTLKEKNPLKNIDVGIIALGQNWNMKKVIATEKKVLQFFGFRVVPQLCWGWQYLQNAKDESLQSYKKGSKKFRRLFIEGFD